MMLQTLILHIETGQWSGFNGQMENADSSIQGLLTVRIPGFE